MIGLTSRRVRRGIAGGAISSAVYAFVVRPWLLDWGSTDDSRHGPLPGDDVLPTTDYQTTRAFTIRASARLIVRDRAQRRLREWPFTALVYEPLHAYMETGLIRGVKRRAEARPA